MPVKDVYGKEVSEQNHMILAHSPTSMLIQELKRRKMIVTGKQLATIQQVRFR